MSNDVTPKVITSNLMAHSGVLDENGNESDNVIRLRAQRVVVRDTSYVLYNPLDLHKIAKNLDVDLIHVHFLYAFLPMFNGFLKAIKRNNIPVIATSHGLTSGYSSKIVQGTAFLLNKLSEKLVISNSSAVTTVSKVEYNFLKKFVPSEKLSYIPNGIDSQFFCPDLSKKQTLRDKLGFSEDDFVVLFFAHLRSAKGVHVFLDAMSDVIKKTREINFIIAGSGPLSYLVNDAEKRFGKRVRSMIGYISDEEVSCLYNACDIYVLPSYVEGMPLSLMEAMACGKPVIATRVSDVPFLVEDGENGFIISPGNSDQLTSSIINLFENYLLMKNMGESNTIKMANFDWARISELYYQLYSQVLTDVSL